MSRIPEQNTVIVLNAISNAYFYGTLAKSSLNTDQTHFNAILKKCNSQILILKI
ncbi:hypothetical protein LEP1GSC050_4180 [Leptospira broomii serovar Hurstbridge str. 5399]|uniref:Uncharacterized protein n=1 Tax=Leptospira broomii serovar Hurstbridge str. 5399 TaxID=1049789 RepID=T0GGF0_9LEPT|nr:hypothetical protein LEP1GSC050_4180 [Leptospira broomii serovar Hurstbridge str. 5399]